MRITRVGGSLGELEAEALIVGRLDEPELSGAAAQVDAALGGALSALAVAGGLSGKPNQVTVVHTLGRLPAARLAVVGVGPADRLDLEQVRRAVAEAWKRVRGEGARRIAVAPPGVAEGLLEPVQAVETAVEAALLTSYRFSRYKRPDDEGEAELLISGTDEAAASVERGIAVGRARSEATCFARDLVNTAPSDLTPLELAAAARTMAEECGLRCHVMDKAELRERGFDLLLAVNRGSASPPALIVLEHRGGQGRSVGLVGKGVCFDSGGLSIKTADGMMTMKGDMSGAAAVLGAMRAIATLAVPLNVTAVIPAVQNLVDAGSMMPGDVVTGLAGKSVEILNTDAEGRLILADALTYATRELGLTPVIDIATLTGACMRALGPVCAGVMGTDGRLVERLRQVGGQAGEKFWELPLDDEFGELMKSPIADLRNISKEAGGGASTAAMFLREFVGETPWAHLDIAGQGLNDTDRPYRPRGASGYGTRTLINLILSLAKAPLA